MNTVNFQCKFDQTLLARRPAASTSSPASRQAPLSMKKARQPWLSNHCCKSSGHEDGFADIVERAMKSGCVKLSRKPGELHQHKPRHLTRLCFRSCCIRLSIPYIMIYMYIYIYICIIINIIMMNDINLHCPGDKLPLRTFGSRSPGLAKQ